MLCCCLRDSTDAQECVTKLFKRHNCIKRNATPADVKPGPEFSPCLVA